MGYHEAYFLEPRIHSVQLRLRSFKIKNERKVYSEQIKRRRIITLVNSARRIFYFFSVGEYDILLNQVNPPSRIFFSFVKNHIFFLAYNEVG